MRASATAHIGIESVAEAVDPYPSRDAFGRVTALTHEGRTHDCERRGWTFSMAARIAYERGDVATFHQYDRAAHQEYMEADLHDLDAAFQEYMEA